jgi:hypothetical protein
VDVRGWRGAKRGAKRFFLKCFERFLVVMNLWRRDGGVTQTNEWHGFLLEMFSEAFDCNEALEWTGRCDTNK